MQHSVYKEGAGTGLLGASILGKAPDIARWSSAFSGIEKSKFNISTLCLFVAMPGVRASCHSLVLEYPLSLDFSEKSERSNRKFGDASLTALRGPMCPALGGRAVNA